MSSISNILNRSKQFWPSVKPLLQSAASIAGTTGMAAALYTQMPIAGSVALAATGVHAYKELRGRCVTPVAQFPSAVWNQLSALKGGVKLNTLSRNRNSSYKQSMQLFRKSSSSSAVSVTAPQTSALPETVSIMHSFIQQERNTFLKTLDQGALLLRLEKAQIPIADKLALLIFLAPLMGDVLPILPLTDGQYNYPECLNALCAYGSAFSLFASRHLMQVDESVFQSKAAAVRHAIQAMENAIASGETPSDTMRQDLQKAIEESSPEKVKQAISTWADSVATPQDLREAIERVSFEAERLKGHTLPREQAAYELCLDRICQNLTD